jgi:hypothetical protein
VNVPTVKHRFDQFAVIDWSGQAVARPKGLALAYAGLGEAAPTLIEMPKGWSREAVCDWLAAHAQAATNILIGLDLSPALPFLAEAAYFPGWVHSPSDAPTLWALVDQLCSEDPHLGASSFVTHAHAGRHFRRQGDCGDLFPPGRGRLRVCEHGQRAMGLSPYSCFNLVGAAQVGKSSLTGMRVFHRLRGAVPVWPFDPIPAQGPVIVEIYTALAARTANVRKGASKIRDAKALDTALEALGTRPHAPLTRYTDHATDAILTTAWLRRAATNPAYWQPDALTPQIAATEGWTFGVI